MAYLGSLAQTVVFLCFPLCAQMTKKIKKLEKETAMYRSRWESSNKALVEMAEEVKQLCIPKKMPILTFLSSVYESCSIKDSCSSFKMYNFAEGSARFV